MYLYPKNVRNSAALSDIDVAIRRPSMDLGATEAQMIYIEDGVAHISGTKYPNTAVSTWIQLYTVGPADDVAIEFDVEWVTYNEKYRPITLGEPWLFRASGGKLLAQKGESLSPLILDEGNVSVVDAARGWYNMLRPWEDHGLVVAYIKNGEVWIRQYCKQQLGNKLWEDAYKLEGITAAVDVSVHRTNDFRISFLITEAGGVIRNVVSERNWAGANNIVSHVSTSASLKTTLIPVEYMDATVSSKANATADITAVLGYSLNNNKFYSIRNEEQSKVVATIEHAMTVTDYKDFVATDAQGRISHCAAVTQTTVNGYTTLNMDFINFNNLVGEVTVKYTGKGNTTNAVGLPFTPFSIKFEPVGLIPTPPPTLVSITNVEDVSYE